MKSPLNRGGLRFYVVAVALAVGTLYIQSTTARSILAGLPLLVVGVCLHTWAKGCLRQNRVVAVIGPYRFVRHPFYLANALIDFALAVMSGWLPLMIFLPVWWLAIYIPVISGEERYLSEKFPDEYPAFRKRVACLIPWRRPLPYSGDGFRWSNPNIVGGEELPRAVRILAYPLLFFVARGLRADGTDWLRDGWHLTALAAQLTLYVFAWQLHRHQRARLPVLPLLLEHPLFRVVAAAAILAGVWSLQGPLTTYRNALPIAGILYLMFSVPFYARRPVRVILAEWFALLGAICAGELLWLAPPATALYAAWLLDRPLLGAAASPDGSRDAAVPAASWPYLYPLVAAACAAVIGIKLAGRLLPGHFI
jgi:protein-S-isoprenylcysteine O-methyltransferase Ste14